MHFFRDLKVFYIDHGLRLLNLANETGLIITNIGMNGIIFNKLFRGRVFVRGFDKWPGKYYLLMRKHPGGLKHN